MQQATATTPSPQAARVPGAKVDSVPAGTEACNKYGRYWVPVGLEERPACRAVLAGEVYEPQTIDFIRRNAADGDVVHAGTFFGDFLPGVSEALAPGAKLWAFEPNPASFECARQTVALNGLRNVELRNAGLSDRQGRMHFRTLDDSGRPLGGLSRFTEEDGPGVVQVETAMIDFTIPADRKVSILQLDVEGHEKPALLGAFHVIRAWRPILVVEYLGQTRWVGRTFRDLGYSHAGRLHGNHVYATTPVTL
jgi:FkbM family methyltransferase